MAKEDINEFIEKIKKTGKAIIVEGQKDKKTLENIGISNIFVLNKKPIFETIEKIAPSNKEAIILTDFDKEGKKLYGKIYQELKRNGIKTDKYFREWLQKNTKLSHIEGLEHYIQNQKI
jgi:5S rRNA maturation endonuclease (ribonuclease M5)